MTDSEIITLIRSSPEKGYRELVKIYGNYVYAVVMNRVRNIAAETDVQECVSDVFIEILKKAQNLDEEKGTIKSFAGKVASARATDLYRRLTRSYSRTADENEFEQLVSNVKPEDETERKLESIFLWSKVTELGSPDSDILIMQYFYRMKAAEIAARLSMSTAAVNKRSLRARKKLKKILEERGGYSE